MIQAQLNDAAVALTQALHQHNVKLGIFGSFAIAVMGGGCETKTISCLALSVTSTQLVAILDGRNGFRVIHQERPDHVAFRWSLKPVSPSNIVVDVFPELYPGALPTMSKLLVGQMSVACSDGTTGTCSILHPLYIFKAKLFAAATRSSHQNSVDLRWLESRYNKEIGPRKGELNLVYIGLAIKQYKELEPLFKRLGVDIKSARKLSGSKSGAASPSGTGTVQRMLLQ